jgi:hypothetical protein
MKGPQITIDYYNRNKYINIIKIGLLISRPGIYE